MAVFNQQIVIFVYSHQNNYRKLVLKLVEKILMHSTLGILQSTKFVTS